MRLLIDWFFFPKKTCYQYNPAQTNRLSTNTWQLYYKYKLRYSHTHNLMKAFGTFAHASHMCRDAHFCAYTEMCGYNTVAHTHLFQALRITLTPPTPFPLWHMEEVWREDSKLAFSNQHAWWSLAAVNRSILSVIWHSAWCCVSRCSRDTYCSLFQRGGRLVKGVSVY